MTFKSDSVNLNKTVGAFFFGAIALCLTTASIASAQVPVPVQLGKAGTFAILSKTGVTDVYASAIHGNVGTSPITGAALLLSCGEVTVTIYTVYATGPLPCTVTDATFLTSSIGDIETAYQDASGRVLPDFTD